MSASLFAFRSRTRATAAAFVLCALGGAGVLAVPSHSTGVNVVLAPELVAPGVISMPNRNETFPVVDPTDGSLWFSVYGDNFDAQTIMVAKRAGESWTEATTAPFSGRYGDRAPRFSVDGRRLYFTSDRPSGAGGATGLNIWVTERQARGGWSEPRVLPEPVNVPGGRQMHSVETNGALYLASYRPGGAGRADIWRIARQQQGYGQATAVGGPINDALGQTDIYVAPDESWLILVVTDPPQGLGGDELLFSERRDGRWTQPRLLGAPVNSAEYEYGPTVSPDGRYLYFTSHRGGSADVYRVPVAEVRR